MAILECVVEKEIDFMPMMSPATEQGIASNVRARVVEQEGLNIIPFDSQKRAQMRKQQELDKRLKAIDKKWDRITAEELESGVKDEPISLADVLLVLSMSGLMVFAMWLVEVFL